MPRTCRKISISFQTKYVKKDYKLVRKLWQMKKKYHKQVLENQLLQARTNAKLPNGIIRPETQMLVKNCWTLLTSFTKEFAKLSTSLWDVTNAEDCTVSPRRHTVVPVTVEPVAGTLNLKIEETVPKVSQQNVPVHNVAATVEIPQENTEYSDVTPENELLAQKDPVVSMEGTLSERIALSTIYEETSSAFFEQSHASHRHYHSISPVSFKTRYTSTPVKADVENEDTQQKPNETLNSSQFVNKRRGTSSIKEQIPTTPRTLLDVTKCERPSCSSSKAEPTPGKKSTGPDSPVKRRRRAASKLVCYAESPLNKKRRRLK